MWIYKSNPLFGILDYPQNEVRVKRLASASLEETDAFPPRQIPKKEEFFIPKQLTILLYVLSKIVYKLSFAFVEPWGRGLEAFLPIGHQQWLVQVAVEVDVGEILYISPVKLVCLVYQLALRSQVPLNT